MGYPMVFIRNERVGCGVTPHVCLTCGTITLLLYLWYDAIKRTQLKCTCMQVLGVWFHYDPSVWFVNIAMEKVYYVLFCASDAL